MGGPGGPWGCYLVPPTGVDRWVVVGCSGGGVVAAQAKRKPKCERDEVRGERERVWAAKWGQGSPKAVLNRK